MKRRISTLVIPALLLSMSTGCSLVVNGRRQAVNISSNPSGAEIIIDGIVHGKTPAIIDLRRDSHHSISINLEGYQTFSMNLERKVSGWVWGNILIGGLIGVVVDASTGAMYKLTPDQVNTVLAQKSNVSAKNNKDQIMIAVSLTPDPSWQKIAQLKLT